MYQVGDRVVHPMHGAGIIESIVQERLGGQLGSYYVFRMPSGGLTLMYTSLKDIFLSYAGQGYSLEFIHRLCSLGSGGLDSMPWNGSIVSVFGICHTTHKASYKYNFVTCAVIPVLCTFLIALPICIWLG